MQVIMIWMSCLSGLMRYVDSKNANDEVWLRHLHFLDFLIEYISQILVQKAYINENLQKHPFE